MTKETKSIIKQTIKKYETLAQYTKDEAQEIYLKVVTFLQNLIDEGGTDELL